jgi:AraC-like DNA-binding protein
LTAAGDPHAFQCNAVVARLRGSTVAELRVDASRIARRAVEIDAGDCGLVKILWQLAGRSRVRQGPNSATLEVGSWTICDPGREYAIELEKGTRFLLILVPRAQCPGWLPALSVLGGRALTTRGPAHIAMAALAAMLRDVVPLDPESEQTLHESIVALVERALTMELGSRGLQAQPERSIQLSHVQAYVLAHLTDTGLNAGKVATVFAVSRRSLYNLFVPSGTTPHAFIQGARLDRACALLGHPNWRQAPITGIARQCGFTDPAHFTRAFRARHGMAPTSWRASAR